MIDKICMFLTNKIRKEITESNHIKTKCFFGINEIAIRNKKATQLNEISPIKAQTKYPSDKIA